MGPWLGQVRVRNHHGSEEPARSRALAQPPAPRCVHGWPCARPRLLPIPPAVQGSLWQEHCLPPSSRGLEQVPLTFGVQERDDAQLALSHLEGVLQVVPRVRVLQLIKVNQVRPGDKARLLKGGGRSIPHLLGSPSTKQRHWTDSWAEVEGGDRSRGGTAVST